MITFATCWYELNSKFNKEKYLEWMKNFLPHVKKFNLVIFTNKESKYIFEDLIKDNEKIKVILLPFKEFGTFNYKKNWIKNQINPANPLYNKISWKVNMLWCEKINFVYRAMEYFDTECYGWCDIGYFREETDNVKEWPHYRMTIDKTKIYYALVNKNGFDYIDKLLKNDEIIPPHQVSIAGGFFITYKKNIAWWKDIFYKKLDFYFENDRLVKDDQIIIVDCVCSNQEKFTLCEENSKYDPWFMFKRIL